MRVDDDGSVADSGGMRGWLYLGALLIGFGLTMLQDPTAQERDVDATQAPLVAEPAGSPDIDATTTHMAPTAKTALNTTGTQSLAVK